MSTLTFQMYNVHKISAVFILNARLLLLISYGLQGNIADFSFSPTV